MTSGQGDPGYDPRCMQYHYLILQSVMALCTTHPFPPQTVPQLPQLRPLVLGEEGGGQPEAKAAAPGHALQGGEPGTWLASVCKVLESVAHLKLQLHK